MDESLKYANQYLHSDIRPFEIVRIVSDKCIEIRAMDYREVEEIVEKRRKEAVSGGYSGHVDNSLQEWVITSNPANPIKRIHLHKSGDWYSYGTLYRLESEPKRFYDFNF